MLNVKYSRTIKGLADTREAFDALTKSLNPALVVAWTKAEKQAMDERGEYLRIYDVNITKRKSQEFHFSVTHS